MESLAEVGPPPVDRPLRLAPFLGWRLVPGRVGDPATARLFARPYRSAAQRLDQWRSRGQLIADSAPAVYVHEYTAGGLTVRGLVGALDLTPHPAPDGLGVVPHEGIHARQVDELAQRMTAGGINPAPILLVHRGPAAIRELVGQAVASAPEQEYVDRADQRHRIWALRDARSLAALDHALAGARTLIADGHHRYAAYLAMQRDRPGTATDRGLAMLVDQTDTQLFLGAIHRVLGGRTLDDLRRACADLGPSGPAYEGRPPADGLAALSADTLVATDGAEWATIALPPAPGRAAVEVLHQDLLPAVRARRPPRAARRSARGGGRGSGRVSYHHSVDEALKKVRQARGVAVLMPAPDYDLVADIAFAGRLLPEKATSFQPKPSVGTLIRFLADEE